MINSNLFQINQIVLTCNAFVVYSHGRLAA